MQSVVVVVVPGGGPVSDRTEAEGVGRNNDNGDAEKTSSAVIERRRRQGLAGGSCNGVGQRENCSGR